MVTLKDDDVAEFSEISQVDALKSNWVRTLGAIVEANAEIKDDDEDFTPVLKLLNKSTTKILAVNKSIYSNSLLDSQKKIRLT